MNISTIQPLQIHLRNLNNLARSDHWALNRCTCAVFLEEGFEERVSSIMKYFKELAVYGFSDDEELRKMAASFCFNLLSKRYKI